MVTDACADEREQVDGSLAILQGQGLPDDTAPAEGEEQVSRAVVQFVESQVCGHENLREYRVDCGEGDSDEEAVSAQMRVRKVQGDARKGFLGITYTARPTM